MSRLGRGRRWSTTVSIVALLLSACADESVRTTAPFPAQSAATTTTSETGSIEVGALLPVTIDDAVWEFPTAACLRGDDDLGIVADAAMQTSDQVRSFVADRASGWPTTTVAGDESAFLQIETLGPLAIALGELGELGEQIEVDWMEFEQAYADTEQGWGPVTEITSRLPSWRAIARRLLEAVPAACTAYLGSPDDFAVPTNDVRWVAGGALGLKGAVRVDVERGDMSILAYARTGRTDAQVYLTAVLDPSGLDVMDALGVEYGEFTNFSEAAAYLPVTTEVDLLPGEYVFAFEATEPITESGALVRAGDPDLPQRLDVVIWMVTNEHVDRKALEARFRSIGDAVFGPHGIEVGSMDFIDPPDDVVERYSVIELIDVEDGDLRSLCREMSASVGGVRALQFAIVDFIEDGDPEGTIEGSAAGLPGTAMLPASDLSCVVGMAGADPNFGGRDLFDRASIIWHEAGHHFGMYHTTEGDGSYFDLFEDTPECPLEERDENDDGYIDLWECADLDAQNIMFYDGDGLELTADQAWMVRRHPLFYPVG